MSDRLQSMKLQINSTLIQNVMWARIWRLLIVVTAVCAFVPWLPVMPQAGLDHSWVLGMNQAVAQGLVFGRDMIFTFGPYASIYTKSFHPATDHLMVAGALFLGLIYGAGLVLLTRERGALPLAGLCLALALVAGLPQSQDTLLFSYPLIVSLYCFGLSDKAVSDQRARNRSTISVVVLFLPFGLLPLIKGSLVALCLAATVFAVIRLISLGRREWAIAAPVAQVVALIVFWLAAGQPLSGLPGYFQSMAQIVSGYTEAMAYPGAPSEIILYLIAAVVLLVSVLRDSGETTIGKRLVLLLPLVVYFFVVFKAAFVRHDGHALTAGTSILLASAILAFRLYKRSLLFVLSVSLVTWISIDSRHLALSAAALLDDAVSPYFSAWAGAQARLADSQALRRDFDAALAKIRAQHALPLREGTADIYSHEQSDLIASGNRWNPRPVLQSYSAYTPALAWANRDHLQGPAAPDTIFFRAETIDGRLPALDDGPSWFALLEHYRPENLQGGFLSLRKETSAGERIRFDAAGEGRFSFDQQVSVPEGQGPVFVEIDVEKSLAGRGMNTLYKVDPLVIVLSLENGEMMQFRLPSEMARSGFMVSPVVLSASDFGLLYANAYAQGSRVKSFFIHAFGGDWQWKNTYTVHFKNVTVAPRAGALASLHFNQPVKAPAGTNIHVVNQCEGIIDAVNGVSPSSAGFSARGLLQVRGWLTVQGEQQRLPTKPLLVLGNAEGELAFIETRRTIRPDIAAHFGSDLLQWAGYDAIADVSQVTGERVLGLAFEQNGQIGICPQFGVAGRFSGAE
ncbi:hypothetical protein RSP781_00650 [Ralstonia pseudosolanacearum]|nr:hypothetical protein F504_88 [Ralstonia pseudosolanacearum FQY_4]OAI72927.1 hypothetical protein RSP781_00650 [Ralstonia pseudosolanacearum]QKL53382.1 hypothetical protein HI816_16775 [Ralstonia solanacearum]QKM24637.1 hypothetical protein HI796_16765 [Ralstonia solanacearum]QKM29445.1 hypothetical protein HI795_16775 [Ralstonia solanacearum]